MKILDEYVIILNILLFILLLYNLFQKCKNIEGHEPSSAEIRNHEEAKSANRDGDSLINEVGETNKDAKVSSENAKKSNENTNWKKHNEEAKENEKKINEALNN